MYIGFNRVTAKAIVKQGFFVTEDSLSEISRQVARLNPPNGVTFPFVSVNLLKGYQHWEASQMRCVLSASDGSCCHAVAIHGGYLYNANEVIALPLCEEALNYCTSTALVQSECVRFRRGY